MNVRRPRAHAQHLVDARQRVVTLTGTVATFAAKNRAMRLARFTKGVSEVKDELRVMPEAVATTGVLPSTLAIDATRSRRRSGPSCSPIRTRRH